MPFCLCRCSVFWPITFPQLSADSGLETAVGGKGTGLFLNGAVTAAQR